MISTVFFDVGETLIDETRLWGEWADWLGIPRLTFFAAVGAVIERDEHHSRVFEAFGLDFDQVRKARRAEGEYWRVLPEDFYPDAVPCLRALRTAGFRIGIAGNQPEAMEESIRTLDLPVDHIASSGSFGVEKPDARFFECVVELAGFPAHEIAYVGDRIDNDVTPAARAEMTAIFIRRGPWAMMQETRLALPNRALRIESLSELPALLTGA